MYMLKNNNLKSISTALLLGCVSMCGLSTPVEAQDVISYVPGYAARILGDHEVAHALSPEARSIIERPVVIHDDHRLGSAAIFAPLMFDISKVVPLAFPYDSIAYQRDLSRLNPYTSASIASRTMEQIGDTGYDRSMLKQLVTAWQNAGMMRSQVFMSRPDLVPYTTSILPKDRIDYAPVEGSGYAGELAIFDVPRVPAEQAQNLAIGVGRRYWIHRFEADAHFAQNQVSANWHKGGNNSLNLNSRLFYEATYERERLKWVNNIEYKLGLFTTTSNKYRNLQISEDLLRLNSNLGLKAAKKWFYTVDLAMRSQLLQNWSNSGVLVTRPFAPAIADAGIGMKYDVDLKEYKGDPFARMRFTANFAPLSAQFIYSWANDIDKGRVGLLPDQSYLFRLGSSVRANLIWDFSSFLTWTSRLLYNTSYKHVEAEFENTITYALTQHLSTKVNVSLRFDDSVILNVPKTFTNLLQYSELFSFGFAYKL